MEKKKLAIIILSIILVASGTWNIIFGVIGPIELTVPKEFTFVRAISGNPYSLDPVDSWDGISNSIINQVVERLWYYDWTDANMSLINMLAESETWLNSTAIEVHLRQGVVFHDLTPFNSQAVKWNIDRLLYLYNHTGELVGRRGHPHSLFETTDGRPLISHYEVTGTYTGIIHLTQPFSSLMELMCYVSAGIISPTSHAGDATSFIDLVDGDLVGTGPFKYDEYIAETEVRFTRFDQYWGGPFFRDIMKDMKVAYFTKMIFVVIEDPIARNHAMLTQSVDWIDDVLPDLFNTLRVDPDITLYESDINHLRYDGLEFNNKQINYTWRKAMAYAFNYTYTIKEYFQDHVSRSYGPISPGFGEWFTEKVKNIAPYLNLTIARQTIVDGIPEAAGLPVNDNPHDDIWTSVTLATFNYSYSKEDLWPTDLFLLLNYWFDRIGINIIDGGTTRSYFLKEVLGYLPGGFDHLQIYWAGWGPDYLDPINMIQPLFSNQSIANSLQVNDSWLEDQFDVYLQETNHSVKVELIHNISIYLARDLIPEVYGIHNLLTVCHKADLYGVPYGFLCYNFYAFPFKRNETYIWH
ncbi:MAG: ABC transporter substrate-binding protein [Promethearchaeota archaeon]